MSLTHAANTIDCADARAVGTFWAAALERPLAEGANPFFAMIPGDEVRPAWLFLAVPEPRSVKNRVHADFTTPDRPAEIERLVGLGAGVLDVHHEYGVSWTTLRDVEGNEFCVADQHSPM